MMKEVKDFIKENPKSLIFTAAVIITIASSIYGNNQILSVLEILFVSVTGLSVKNYMQGAVPELISAEAIRVKEDNSTIYISEEESDEGA